MLLATLLALASAAGPQPSGQQVVGDLPALRARISQLEAAFAAVQCQGAATAVPTCTACTPTTATVGTRVTCTGDYLGCSSAAVFGSSASTNVTLTPGVLNGVSAVVPNDAVSGPIYFTANGQQAACPTFTVGAPSQAPVISSFTATPSAIAAGQSATLSWSVSGQTSLSIDQGIGTVTGTSRSVSPGATTAYVLTATNAAGSSTATATVTVGTAPTINSFSPASGPVGSYVYILGANLTGPNNEGATAVTFGGTNAATGCVCTSGACNCLVPNGAITGPICITTTSQTCSSVDFVVTSGITIADVQVSDPPATQAGTCQSLSATVTTTPVGQCGSIDCSVSWTFVTPCTGGTLTSTGSTTAQFCAPATPPGSGACYIQATSVQSGSSCNHSGTVLTPCSDTMTAAVSAAPAPSYGTPILGTPSSPNNRPIADWAPGIRAQYGLATQSPELYLNLRDSAATANLQAGISGNWGAPYVAFGSDAYSPYVITAAAGGAGDTCGGTCTSVGMQGQAGAAVAGDCPLDIGKPWQGQVRIANGAQYWDPDFGLRAITTYITAAGSDVHWQVVDVARNRIYAFYSYGGQGFGLSGGYLRSSARGCDLLSANGTDGAGDAAVLAAQEPPSVRYNCAAGGTASNDSSCGLPPGSGLAQYGDFGNGDSNGYLGPHGSIMPQDFDDTGWSGAAVGTLHHALRCSIPDSMGYGGTWPMWEVGGTPGRSLRNGQIIRLRPDYDEEAITGGGSPTTAQLAARRVLRTLQVYGCVISDWANYGMELFAMGDWGGVGWTVGSNSPWSAAGGANAEAQAFATGQNGNGTKAGALPGLDMTQLEIVLPIGHSYPAR